MRPPTDCRPHRLSASEIETVTRLKDEIARHSYRVNAEAVAREILFKLRMISAGRRALLADTPANEGGRPPATHE
jgi:Anti-sigma-28 factor, FlgM